MVWCLRVRGLLAIRCRPGQAVVPAFPSRAGHLALWAKPRPQVDDNLVLEPTCSSPSQAVSTIGRSFFAASLPLVVFPASLSQARKSRCGWGLRDGCSSHSKAGRGMVNEGMVDVRRQSLGRDDDGGRQSGRRDVTGKEALHVCLPSRGWSWWHGALDSKFAC